jgi:hypothetical protein
MHPIATVELYLYPVIPTECALGYCPNPVEATFMVAWQA